MPPKRDFLDFITDASKRTSRLAERFCEELNKEGATAEGLHQFLRREGYEGVSLKACNKLMHIKANTGSIESELLKRAY